MTVQPLLPRVTRRTLVATLVGVLLFGVGAAAASAQVLVPAPVAADTYWIEWDQHEPEAATFDYILVVDGQRQAPQKPTRCAGTVCRLPFPALTPGNHILVLLAARTVDGKRLESGPSNELQVRLIVAPGAPQRLRSVAIAP